MTLIQDKSIFSPITIVFNQATTVTLVLSGAGNTIGSSGLRWANGTNTITVSGLTGQTISLPFAIDFLPTTRKYNAICTVTVGTEKVAYSISNVITNNYSDAAPTDKNVYWVGLYCFGLGAVGNPNFDDNYMFGCDGLLESNLSTPIKLFFLKPSPTSGTLTLTVNRVFENNDPAIEIVTTKTYLAGDAEIILFSGTELKDAIGTSGLAGYYEVTAVLSDPNSQGMLNKYYWGVNGQIPVVFLGSSTTYSQPTGAIFLGSSTTYSQPTGAIFLGSNTTYNQPNGAIFLGSNTTYNQS